MPAAGNRFHATYRLAGAATERDARARALDLCIEQTVEFPVDLIRDDRIRTDVCGQLVALEPLAPGVWEAVISYVAAIAAGGLPELLNVLFGNASLQPGLRLTRFEPSEGLLGGFRGPRFGRAGVRALFGAPPRPLLCTALKPLGLGAGELAELAYRFALGGIDLVKDDHGLADQAVCPFAARVERCAAAVARANRESGGCSVYAPNVTAPVDLARERARFARQAGAGALLFAPGLAGFDLMRALADDGELALPILCHPALLGSFVVRPDEGISPFALFGQIVRLAGADAVIFPNHGGRFAFTPEDCGAIIEGTCAPMGALRPSLPMPAGGMSLARVPELAARYGPEAILLIGGDLHRHGPDLSASCRKLLRIAEGGFRIAD